MIRLQNTTIAKKYNYKKLKALSIIVFFTLFSCGEDTEKIEDLKIEQEVVQDTSNLIIDFEMINEVEGTKKMGVLEGDIFYSYNQLAEMGFEVGSDGKLKSISVKNINKKISKKLRVERNRVNLCKGAYFKNKKRVIDININRVNSKAKRAITSAIKELNRLNMGLAFRVVKSVGIPCSRITVYTKKLLPEGTAGRAGSPRDGNPSPTINLLKDRMKKE